MTLATGVGSAAGAGSLAVTVLTGSVVVPAVESSVTVATAIAGAGGVDPEDEFASGVEELAPVVDPVS
ncbi:hypothetical protein BST22_18765 [Mycolicibacterium chubuense]|uniref:Uncharacterized protein n=1 Tax=Mycolicibacterium chubuense TaxID=1800 RepID=A0A0J6YM96_MYCCU|nr:hypothetical protein MCHUDSM44219_03933 [Mycolicibacterium chubuense]ORA48226.1 hypothetical protein BST22_18765 [Mycolicibacterium chubuense]SPX97682.1 Uncharacterised protein [Mycolicibacterium chubuense]